MWDKGQRPREGHSHRKLFSERLCLSTCCLCKVSVPPAQPASSPEPWIHRDASAEPESLPLLRVPPIPHCVQVKMFSLSFSKVLLYSEGF